MTDVTEDRDQDGAELSAADEQLLRELTERARGHQDNRYRKTPGHRVRARLFLAAIPGTVVRKEDSPGACRAADRGTARHPRRDTRAATMPASRSRHHENRLKERHGTQRQ